MTASSAFALTDGPFAANYGTSGSQQTVDFSTSLVFPAFNNLTGPLAGAILDDVSVVLHGGSAATQSVQNTGASSAVFQLTTSISITLLDPLGNSIVTAIPTVINTTVPPLGAGQTKNFGTTAGTDTKTVTYTSNLGTFAGTGNLSLALFSLTSTSAAGGGGNNIPNFATTGFADGTVTYDYHFSSNVPEPKVYGAIGAVACLGLLGYRRFRNGQAAQA